MAQKLARVNDETDFVTCLYCKKEFECMIDEKLINSNSINNTYQIYSKCPHCNYEYYFWREDGILRKMMKDKANRLYEFFTEKDKISQYNHVLECRSLNNQIIGRRKLLNKF